MTSKAIWLNTFPEKFVHVQSFRKITFWDILFFFNQSTPILGFYCNCHVFFTWTPELEPYMIDGKMSTPTDA